MNSTSDSDGRQRYPGCFEPARIGNVEVRNRIFVPAHTTNFGRNHLPTDQHVAYHEARARGGAGLIIMESLRVHETSLGKPQGLAAYDPRCIEPLRKIADAVHRHDTPILGQIIHLGRQVDGDALRLPSWGPSAIAWDAAATAPHVMHRADLEAVVVGHVRSAHNVLEARFDGIEVHVGHGHLLQQFLSPATNRRDDEYGGGEPNRMRLAVDVLRALRDEFGPDVCMGIRVSGDEYASGGLTIDDMCRIVPALVAHQQIDFVNVSHSAYHGAYSLSTQIADMAFAADHFRHLAPRIKHSLRASGHTMPVMAVCKFRTLRDAEDVLAAGDADLVGMARAHIADPDLVRKALERREDEQRTCVGCNQGCAGFLEKGLPITCVVNPSVGRERTWSPDPRDDPASTPLDVAIVGGGPAGLEAAWVAAARGHRVELFEADLELGGQLRAVEQMPKRNDFLALLREQIAACRRNGVSIHTGTAIDAKRLSTLDVDHVVMATGAHPTVVEFPDGGVGLTLADALAAVWQPGQRVAVYDLLGDWASASVVEHLADLGAKVTYVTPVAGYVWKVTRYSKTAMATRWRDADVAIQLLRSARSYDDGEFVVKDVSNGELHTLTVDAVVASGNPAANSELFDELVARGVDVTMIGDCLAPRTALEAVYEGHAVARGL
jgi:2,4-dienoyl-CoA reductase-like NADH-dependent reductase (Old Yellow Enzyme family)/thioredoxin reductase